MEGKVDTPEAKNISLAQARPVKDAPTMAGLAAAAIPTAAEQREFLRMEKMKFEHCLRLEKDMGEVLVTKQPENGIGLPSAEAHAINALLLGIQDKLFAKPVVENLDVMRQSLSVGYEPIMGSRVLKPQPADELRKHGVPGFWFSWPGVNTSTDAPVVLYVHGGGGHSGNSLFTWGYLDRLSRVFNRRVLSIEQRLCPENKFTDAVDDVANAVKFLANNQSVKPSDIILTGEDTGASLILLALISLHKEGITPGAAWVHSPIGSFDKGDHEKYRQPVFKKGCEILFAENAFDSFKHVRGDGTENEIKQGDAAINPLYADFKGLSTAIRVTGAEDSVLMPETKELIHVLRKADVKVSESWRSSVCHMYAMMDTPEAGEEIRSAADWYSSCCCNA